jgi:hypothetical protein
MLTLGKIQGQWWNFWKCHFFDWYIHVYPMYDWYIFHL